MDLQELLDREAIRVVIYRYSRGADRHDEALLRSVYHPGARDNHGTFDGPAEDFATYIMQSGGAGFSAGQHHIGNILIEVDGDVAHVESVFVCHLVTDDEKGRRFDVLGGRYWDRMEKRQGEWKIADRTVLLDWSEQRCDIQAAASAASFVPGRRNATDMTYT